MRVYTIRVKPSSSREEVLPLGQDEFEIRTKQPPTRGKANKDAVKLLARHLAVSPSQLLLTRGEGSPIKQVLFLG